MGGRLLRPPAAAVRPDTGRIAERYGGLCDTDDVVVAPDGSLIATCAGEGRWCGFSGDGAVGVLSVVGRGVNPIALEPGGKAVVVGFGTTDDDRLLRVLDGGPVEVVADGLPVLNGFGGPDGWPTRRPGSGRRCWDRPEV